MSRAGRILVVAAAWLLPVAWLSAALLAAPSDGTIISGSVLQRAPEWGPGLTVAAELREGPLEAGDVVVAIDGQPVSAWVAGTSASRRALGDTVSYELVRPARELDLRLVRELTLHRYPVAAGLVRGGAAAGGFVLFLAVASALFWRRPQRPAQRALLAASALLPASMTSAPLGLGVVDLAGGRGIWPQLVGEAMATVGAGCCVLAAATLVPGRRDRSPRRRWLLAGAVLAPLAAYAAWRLGVSRALSSDPADQLQAEATVLLPGLVLAVPTVLAVLGLAHVRARERADRLATRLALVALLAGLVAWLLLDLLPAVLTGDPLLPRTVLVLLLVPSVLGCVAVALDGHRLEVVEPAVRRALVRGAATLLVAGLFLAAAAAVGRLSDVALRPLLTGGIVALAVLPLAVLLQRAARRVLYGDRELPRRIVSELRRLDLRLSPEEALREALTLLARRLRLSHAAIAVRQADGTADLVVGVGESRGRPVAVELVAGGTDLGRLSLEVAPDRDPFGPGDQRLLEDVGAQVGALVQAVLANEELQHVRERLVTAREEERRRLRRDLHDGLGPSLAVLAMRLEEAAELIPDQPGRAAELMESLSERAREEIAEVRRLVDGLRPPALDQLGLVSALRQRAAEQGDGSATGARMTWSVEAEDLGELPAAVEVAAYRIVLEAVTNALRHSGGRSCRVLLRRDDTTLVVEVRDTGRGLAADRGTGVGLTSMRHRAEELGGSCTVSSSAAGTQVEARLPLDGVEGD